MIDMDSIVFTEDEKVTTKGLKTNPNQPTETISNPIDIDSIQFDDAPEPPKKSVFSRLAEAAFDPIQAGARYGVEMGMESAKDIPLKMDEDPRKAPNSLTISNMTGIPHDEIEKHYDKIKFLADLSFKGPSQAGLEVGKRVDPVTTSAIVEKTMTPALVMAAIANPLGTAAGLVAFTALDKIIPTDKFIPEDATESQAASIELVAMLAKGAIVGGFLHKGAKLLNPFEKLNLDKLDYNKGELLKRHTYEKLREKSLPDVITITPEQLAKIGEATKREAEVPGVAVLESIGIDAKTAETAIKNNLNVKIPAEKLVKLAVESGDDFNAIREVMAPIKEVEGSGATKTRGLSQGVEAKAIEKKLTEGFGDLPEYQVVNMKDQATKAAELVSGNYETAKRIAMGEEPAPQGLIPESVFMAVENKAILEGDSVTLRELATASKLTTEATTMGQRIRTLAERDPESPTGAIKEVLKTREEVAQKRLGKKKTIAKEIEKVSGEIKKAVSQVKHTKETWAEFITGLKC